VTATPTATPTVTPTVTKTPTNTPTPTSLPTKFIVQSCTEPIRQIAVNNSGLLIVTVGDFVRLNGTGYSGCWEIIGTTLGGTATSIISVHNDCTCT
jgi:hypothetical protein